MRATTYAPSGLVCSPDHLASSAGVAMLRAGGTAADAAVATSAVLTVTSPHLCGIGGDLLAMVQEPGREPQALNASGRAGSGADPDRLRQEGHSVMPFRHDVRAAPVPGCVDGWLALHERLGRLRLDDVLGPAISYAEDGFPAAPLLAAAVLLLADVPDVEDLRPPIESGQRIRRPGVGRALRAVATGDRGAFYRGEFGDALLAVGAGEYVESDLERSLAEWGPALRLRAWGHDLWTVPPNSQGYITLAAAWIASGLDLPDDPEDPRSAHLLIEAVRQAGHDRHEVLHDGADGAALLAEARLAPRRAAIDPERAWDGSAPGTEGGTIALCVIDADRLGISLLQSNASDFGAHVAVPGTGILLHNRGIGFSLTPGHAAEYGPRRRPPHTLSPLLVTGPGGALRATLGTMGGDTQPQILLQLTARLLAAGATPGAAVAAPRWRLLNPEGTTFDTWRAETMVIGLEHDAPEGWDAALEGRGHRVRREPRAAAHGFGHAHAIVVEDDHLVGAADPRSEVGAAAGL